MARIRSKDTKPELFVRQLLWAAGYRYRLHVRGLPGRPDVVLRSLRAVVFVNGCFWHGHSCQKGRIPEGNSDFWRKKFEANQTRDKRVRAELKRMGWRVTVVWECSLSTIARREQATKKLPDFLAKARHDAIARGAADRCNVKI